MKVSFHCRTLSYLIKRGENSDGFDLKVLAVTSNIIRFKLGVFIETCHNSEFHGVRLLRYDSREYINHSL